MHCGSVSRAAERLFLAPPKGGAVSRRLTERAYTAVCKNFVAAGKRPLSHASRASSPFRGAFGGHCTPKASPERGGGTACGGEVPRLMKNLTVCRYN